MLKTIGFIGILDKRKVDCLVDLDVNASFHFYEVIKQAQV